MSPRVVSDPTIGSVEPVVADARTAEMDRVLAFLGLDDPPDLEVTDAARIDRIALLERIKAAAAGAQSAEMVQFARSQVAVQQAQDVHPRQIGRGIGQQIGLACKVSPWIGSRRLADARALWFDLPHTLAALRQGQISDYLASIVCHETSHLDQRTRRMVDAQLADQDLSGKSPKEASAAARKLAYQADPVGAVNRARIEEKERRVSIRPAPDTMSILTGYLPASHGVAAYAALSQAADTCRANGDPRSRGQIMADTLVERVTGQATAQDVNVEINLTMPLETLVDDDSPKPADLRNYGPIPAPLARALLATTKGRVFLRRLFTSPTGHLVGADQRRRRFDEALATLIRCRDQVCRDPFCDAPIRHLDHIHRHTDGGTTTLINSRGVCERGNYIREMPGWHVTVLDHGLGERPHRIRVTTPTGHTYTSEAPQPP